jgi:zinc protease
MLALLLAAAPPARGQEVLEATLDNGLRVLLEEDPRSPVAALQIWYRVGSRDERIGLSGLSHFLEHMMFRGTPTHGPGVFSRLVEGHGGQDNAYTSRDATVYVTDVPADRLGAVLALEADRMRQLSLDPREVEAERRVLMEERRTRSEDDPVGALAEEFNAVAFLAHPYRIPTIGYMADIRGLTSADLRAWYDTYYRPNNAIVVAAGGFRAAELLAEVRARFDAIPRGPDPPPMRIAEPEQRGERRVVVRREAKLPVVFAGFPAPNHRSPDAYALEVLSTVLSGGRASRLHQRLVVETRLALDAGGEYTRLSLDPESFTFYATVMPGRTVEEVERVLDEELARLRAEPPSAEELRRAQNQLEAAYLFARDSVHARASTLGRHELVGGWRLRDRFLPGIQAVTGADVLRVARRYLVRERQTTAILLPGAPSPAAAVPR